VCFICPNQYTELDDLIHHLELEHKQISSEVLEESTRARQTKKDVGNYMEAAKKETIFECPTCFDIFSSLDKLQQHAIKQHELLLTNEVIEKLNGFNADSPPQCSRCHRYFIAIITTKIENKAQFVCFDCYEKYYGQNALQKVTILFILSSSLE